MFSKFEDAISVIDRELAKRRPKWTLAAIAWMDFDDVAQIIRLHIFKKWHLYDKSRPFVPWVNRVISSQIKNLIRNVYGNFSRPCLRCAAAEDADGCTIYGKQCSDCPLFKYWEQHKKAAFDTKLALSLENHILEVSNLPDDSLNIERSVRQLHEKMLKCLKPLERKIYKLLFIDGKSDEEAARTVGWLCREKNRAAGYKSLSNVKKVIIAKAKKLLKNDEIEFWN